MGVVKLVDKAGAEHELQALEGWRVMEILRDWGMFVPPRCNGSGQCGMCHVKVAPDWTGRLPLPEDPEIDAVEQIPGHDRRSRLSCQILWTEALDGLTLSLP